MGVETPFWGGADTHREMNCPSFQPRLDYLTCQTVWCYHIFCIISTSVNLLICENCHERITCFEHKRSSQTAWMYRNMDSQARIRGQAKSIRLRRQWRSCRA